jgi:hypothetical protein
MNALAASFALPGWPHQKMPLVTRVRRTPARSKLLDLADHIFSVIWHCLVGANSKKMECRAEATIAA